MAQLSGWVVVLASPGAGAAIKRIDYLGTNPVSVKGSIVLPIVEVKPPLNAGEEYGQPTITHDGITATRTWPVTVSKTDTDLDADTLNSELLASGSVFRGLMSVVLDEINLLRTKAGLATRSMAQFKNAIQAKMR